MLAKDLINTDFNPLKPSDSVAAALAKMDAWQTSAIPVIEPSTKKVIGQLQFEDIADINNENVELRDIEWQKPVYTFQNQHIFEVAREMLRHEVRLLAIADENETYLGIVEKKNVLEALSEMLNIATSGSVIMVQMQKSDFTLSKLIHLIETEGAKILGLTVERPEFDESAVQISIKLTHEDTSAVVSSLKRHDFNAATVNRNDLVQVDLTSRANELIRYLDL